MVVHRFRDSSYFMQTKVFETPQYVYDVIKMIQWLHYVRESYAIR